jgi:hypothetical protein
VSPQRVETSTLVEHISFALVESGARLISRERYANWPEAAFAYEDDFSVIAVWAYESFRDLRDGWLSAQDAMGRLVSSNILSPDPKAWDGYLVLCTGDTVNTQLSAELNFIRSDTRRLRKLVVTGDDLDADTVMNAARIRQAIAPILAIRLITADEQFDPLATLTSRVAGDSTFNTDLVTVLTAYSLGQPLVASIHADDQANGPSDLESL